METKLLNIMLMLQNCCTLLHSNHTLLPLIQCKVFNDKNQMRVQKIVSFAYFTALALPFSELTQLGKNDYENRLAVRISFLDRLQIVFT